MRRHSPFQSRRIHGADKLTAEDRQQVDTIAEIASAILQTCGKDIGLTEEEVPEAIHFARQFWTNYAIDQRSAGLEP